VELDKVLVAHQLEDLSLLLDPLGRHLAVGTQHPQLVLRGLDAVRLLYPSVVGNLEASFDFRNPLNIPITPDNILQVFQEAHITGVLTLRIHERDLLHLALQNQKAIVVQVNALILEDFADLRKTDLSPVQVISAITFCIHFARHCKLAPLDDSEGIGVRLIIQNLLKVDFDCAVLNILVLLRAVDQLGQLIQAHLLCALAENEEQRLYQVTLAGAVWPNHSSEVLVQGADNLLTEVALEVFELHPLDHQPLVGFIFVCTDALLINDEFLLTCVDHL